VTALTPSDASGDWDRATVTRGALTFLVCLVGFVLIAWRVNQPGIPGIDTATTTFVHGLASPTLDAFMHAATFLGSSPVLAVVVGIAVVLLVAQRRREEAAFIVVAFVGSLILNDMLKQLVQRPRPGFDWAEVPPETSFPSGHSMNSFVVYVAIALVIWRVRGRRPGIVALVLAVVLVASVGISRIYLGAHWLSDVIGGYLAGALWLLVLAAAWTLISRFRRGRLRDAAAGDGELRPGPSRGAR
jgi:undecaprenyl-diphosphatase